MVDPNILVPNPLFTNLSYLWMTQLHLFLQFSCFSQSWHISPLPPRHYPLVYSTPILSSRMHYLSERYSSLLRRGRSTRWLSVSFSIPHLSPLVEECLTRGLLARLVSSHIPLGASPLRSRIPLPSILLLLSSRLFRTFAGLKRPSSDILFSQTRLKSNSK